MTPQRFTRLFSNIVFFLLGVAFMLIALVIIGISAWRLFTHTCENCDVLQELLNFVGFLIIGVAIFDVGQYLLEEQAFKERKQRTASETRRSLTRFMVIILIAVSLDSLLNVLKASTADIRLLVYPAVLIFVAVFLLIGLGLYQKYSNLNEREPKE